MGRQLKAWALCESILGQYLSDCLRNGEPIQISASNGEIYEIDPDGPSLKCLTRKEKYCVHPKDSLMYPVGDMVVLWWTFLHNDPDRLETVVGRPSDGHRTPMEPERFGMALGGSPEDITTTTMAGMMDNPIEMLSHLPAYIREISMNALGTISQLYLNGDIEVNWR